MNEREIHTTFAGGPLDRRGELRGDRAMLTKLLTHSDTRFVALWKHRCLVSDDAAVLLQQSDVEQVSDLSKQAVFLGEQDKQFLFALRLPDENPPNLAQRGEFLELREAMSHLPADDASLIAYARAMISWQDRHAYCGSCGRPNQPEQAGFVMACTDQSCGHRSFPRLDPAIIVLVQHEDACLLGRQPSWPEDRFSTLAGFVEPGESLEDAVRREVHEETNVRVSNCRYLASQPWPFPAALMIGFHADANNTALRYNDGELAEARWLTRAQIKAREVTLPPPTSVAFKLIEAWFDRDGEPGLDELGLAGPPLRVRRPGDASS